MSQSHYDAGPRTRHWLTAAVCLAALLALLAARGQLEVLAGHDYRLAVRFGVLALVGVLGILAVREGMSAIFAGLGKSQSAITSRNLLSWTLYLLLGVVIASSAGANLSAFLFGGAVLGVVIATLAQTSLGNFFSGIVLMTSRPYRVGELVYLRSGDFGGAEYEGVIVDMGGLYTTLSSRGQLLRIPNSTVIRSVLMTRYTPVRAELELDLPVNAELRQIEDDIVDALSLPSHALVQLEPKRFAHAETGSRMGARLLIRADQPISTEQLVQALERAVTRQSVSAASAASRR